jgi:hypothetical protein
MSSGCAATPASAAGTTPSPDGSENWWFNYRDADGSLKRRSSGTTDKQVAEAVLAQALAEVAATKQARLMAAADELGLHEPSHGTLEQRILRLEDMIGRIIRLHVGLHELLRLWVEGEVRVRDTE